MPIGRLLAAASARGFCFRRPLSTAAAATDSRRGDWWTCLSQLRVPEHLAMHSGGLPLPDPDDGVVRLLACQACCTSQDGLLLLSIEDIRLSDQGGDLLRRFTGLADPHQLPGMTHYVFNPYNREISSCLPEIEGPKKILAGFNLGLLTQADAGRPGPPDRYAVAEMDMEGHLMLRFLSETGEWEIVQGSPCQLPAGRRLVPDQEVVAWNGKLWWVDLTLGAIFADPFSDRPEPCFVQLPSGTVLPADMSVKAFHEAVRRGNHDRWKRQPELYRRVGVSGGWLRYVEVSQEEPFVLSSFKIDADGSGWTLEHRVALSRPWADGGHPWLPLQGEMTPQIGDLDLAEANVVYIKLGKHIVCVDMHREEITGHCPHGDDEDVLTCIITSWLPTTRIPAFPGKKDATKRNTLADVLVRSDRRQEK
ncbi:hypothetical protein BRADI_4g13420v3 [Brachypodium distachyon]|uniref:DUF1618 domain-containing protein n=1 Tax=Brachypodium distachyon TaxID=15368 RepID=A0A0Q3EJ80_BRADI|nr:hypothetical protein BRADI_4g13420v3 [Brachypodium distachyon]